jgi:hypothetical protein
VERRGGVRFHERRVCGKSADGRIDLHRSLRGRGAGSRLVVGGGLIRLDRRILLGRARGDLLDDRLEAADARQRLAARVEGSASVARPL